jgi:hypothetical protein
MLSSWRSTNSCKRRVMNGLRNAYGQLNSNAVENILKTVQNF